MLISEEYRKQNELKHSESKDYGTSGKRYIQIVNNLCKKLNTQDVLDYGCGKSTLAQGLPFEIQQYDPAVFKYSKKPVPADILVCTDVMEHIEPECLEDVLDHIQSLTKKVGMFTVSMVPAKKTLPDGRNAHLIIEDYRFWLPKFWERFNIVCLENAMTKYDPAGNGFLLIVEPK